MIYGELMSRENEDVSILVKADNHKWSYLCDCGEAERLTAADCIRLRAIFISHTHIDHFINFDTILRFQLGIERTVTICGPEGISSHLQAKLKAYNWNLIEKGSVKYEIREIGSAGGIELYELDPPGWELEYRGGMIGPVIFENDNLQVSYVLLDHGIPSAAYLFREPDSIKVKELPYRPGPWVGALKEAYKLGRPGDELSIEGQVKRAEELFYCLELEKGYSMGVVMDHLACEANHKKIVGHFQGVDRLFIESYYLNDDYELALKNYHSTAGESGRVARLAGAAEVVPIHFSRRYGADCRALAAECLEEFNRS